MLSVNSEGVLFNSAVDNKYRVLKNQIRWINPESEEYQQISKQVLESQVKAQNMEIKNIFGLSRPEESKNYESCKISNKRLLYHGSRISNWVGLLSRGILMPKVVVGLGGLRTDFGYLGAGVYFAESAEASAQYTTPGAKGTRLMLACGVKLGRVKDYYNITKGLVSAPEGFDSTHGVSRRHGQNSDFDDDEYVIYDLNQQRQEYLIEFRDTQKDPQPSRFNFTAVPTAQNVVQRSNQPQQKPVKKQKISLKSMPCRVEYAKSNRSSCKRCKGTIVKGTIRIGQEYSLDHSGQWWYHLRCFRNYPKTEVKASEHLFGLELLNLVDQQKVEKAYAKAQNREPDLDSLIKPGSNLKESGKQVRFKKPEKQSKSISKPKPKLKPKPNLKLKSKSKPMMMKVVDTQSQDQETAGIDLETQNQQVFYSISDFNGCLDSDLQLDPSAFAPPVAPQQPIQYSLEGSDIGGEISPQSQQEGLVAIETVEVPSVGSSVAVTEYKQETVKPKLKSYLKPVKSRKIPKNLSKTELRRRLEESQRQVEELQRLLAEYTHQSPTEPSRGLTGPSLTQGIMLSPPEEPNLSENYTQNKTELVPPAGDGIMCLTSALCRLFPEPNPDLQDALIDLALRVGVEGEQDLIPDSGSYGVPSTSSDEEIIPLDASYDLPEDKGEAVVSTESFYSLPDSEPQETPKTSQTVDLRSDTAKLLLLIAVLYKANRLSLQERRKAKQLILKQDSGMIMIHWCFIYFLSHFFVS